jgi:hypothetical protein
MLIFLSFMPSKKYFHILEQIFMTLKLCMRDFKKKWPYMPKHMLFCMKNVSDLQKMLMHITKQIYK